MSDLINCSPSLNTRTPGQLLSLTSHLSFGSVEKKSNSNQSQITSNLMHAMNRQSNIFLNFHKFRLKLNISKFIVESPELELDSSKHNDSHVSGISPFLSAEDINVSINHHTHNTNVIFGKIIIVHFFFINFWCVYRLNHLRTILVILVLANRQIAVVHQKIV